jgi:hypothetical protein
VQPVLAAGGGYLFKRDPSGGPMCFDIAGNKAPLAKCSALQTPVDNLAGLGSLGHYGRGSLGA